MERDALVQKKLESMVDLNDVALFVNVVRAGSFAEVGRRLGIPSSTVSRRIQQLEQGIGVRLMQRSTRRLALTDAGRTYFSECAAQVDALTQSTQQLAGDSGAPVGRVRVAAPADFFNWFPPAAIAEFLRRHPGLRLEFELNDSRADLLGEGIDVAVRAGEMVEPTLVARQIGWGRGTMVASPTYLAERGVPTSVQELSRHECITAPSRGIPPTRWRLGGGDEQLVSGRFQASTAQAQLGAALAGMGIALLPAQMVSSHLRDGRLREVLHGHAPAAVGVYIVYLSRQHLPRAVRVFTEFFVAAMLEAGMISLDSPPE